jgi:hypothetical protein
MKRRAAAKSTFAICEVGKHKTNEKLINLMVGVKGTDN